MKQNKFITGGLAGVLALAFSVPALAGLSTGEKLADYRQLVTTVEQSYAPLRWKQQTVGLDWPTLVENYREQVRRTSTDLEFQQVLTRFLMSLQDAHVSVQIPSSFRSSLGFLSDYVQGKVLIDTIDRKALPEQLFPFKKGDELVAIGGVPVATLMDRLALNSTTGHGPSTKRLNAAFLTYRREERGLEAPRGITNVTILKAGETTPVTISLAWINSGRTVVEPADLAPMDVPTSPLFRGSLAQDLRNLSLAKFSLPTEKRADFVQAGLSDLGNPRPMFRLPADAVEFPQFPFLVAMYERAGKKIGVLRIPEYGDDQFGATVGMALAGLEEMVDVLVIDQTNNPGGYVSTVSLISSFLAKGSIKDAQFALRPSRRWMDKFAEINGIIEQMLAADPNDLAANALRPRFQYLEGLVRDSFQSRTFLTTPFSLDLTGSLGMINPNPYVQFTKPVLLLINELDFSGGDVFPSIMQDSQRAVLFGARTSGAGGNVDGYGPLQNSGFKFHLTESLIVRANGQFIENLGVTPDISYEVTKEDFMTEYRPYVQAFTCEALKLVSAACPANVFEAPAETGTSGETVKPEAATK